MSDLSIHTIVNLSMLLVVLLCVLFDRMAERHEHFKRLENPVTKAIAGAVVTFFTCAVLLALTIF